MPTTSSHFTKFLKGIKILHLAFAIGVAAIIFILKFILGPSQVRDSSMLFSYIALAVAIGSAFMGSFIYNKKVANIRSNQQLSPMNKLKEYRAAFIFKIATLEGPSLIAAILHFLEGNPITFYIALAMLALLVVQRPMEDKVKGEIGLTNQELSQLS